MMDLPLVAVACVLVWHVLSQGGHVMYCLVTLAKEYSGQPHKRTA